MNDEILVKWANLVLKSGINIKKGQCIRIVAEPVHWHAVNILAKTAYELGAKYVEPLVEHPQFKKDRVNNLSEEYLDYRPEYTKTKFQEFIDEEWAYIGVGGLEFPDMNSDMDQDRNAVFTKKDRELSKAYDKARLAGQCPWTLCALPTDNWAAKILEKEPSPEATKELWDIMIPIYRLDKDDPAKAWQDQSALLHSRCETLNDSVLDYVHFEGPGTDLKIYMCEISEWAGGQWDMGDKGMFLPNIPTEEVFTTPDYRKTEGKIKVTRPVEVLGNQVVGAWFEFKNGEVVDYGADQNKEQLDQFFKIDPNAKRLGEVALVDVDSPIYKADKTFHNILFDENASCHIALGRGISLGLKDGDKLSEEELKEAGFNDSLLHTDFMVGSDEVSVIGYKRSGDVLPIIKNGKFVI